jgi:hypothetical protein
VKRDQLPVDDINNADRMLAIIILAGFFAFSVFTLVKFIHWMFP